MSPSAQGSLSWGRAMRYMCCEQFCWCRLWPSACGVHVATCTQEGSKATRAADVPSTARAYTWHVGLR